MNWKIVHSYGNRVEAEMGVSLLAASGIEAIINGGDMGGTNPLYSYSFGVNVLVEEANVAEASKLLKEQVENNDVDRPAPTPLTGVTRALFYAMQLSWICSIISLLVLLAEPSVTATLGGDFPILLYCVYTLSFILTISYVMSKRAAENRNRERMN